MKNLTTILLLLGSMFILSNCKDDCADKKTPLKDLHLYVPYTGTETLRFLHNSTDTQFFIGQGMERFYVTEAQKDDYDCPEDHESVRIRFVNPKTLDEIKMEYVFDKAQFAGYSGVNQNTFFKFYYNGNFLGNQKTMQFSSPTIEINKTAYYTLGLFVFSTTEDTINYFMYRRSFDINPSGILKIKQASDNLTILK